MSGHHPKLVARINAAKTSSRPFWTIIQVVFQRHSWAWQMLIFGICFTSYYVIKEPMVAFYKFNNTGRTYEAAMTKERAHKKKLREIEEAEAAA
jgi:hypothetical protein